MKSLMQYDYSNIRPVRIIVVSFILVGRIGRSAKDAILDVLRKYILIYHSAGTYCAFYYETRRRSESAYIHQMLKTGLSVHRQTDRQTDKSETVYPPVSLRSLGG